jgi:hypothetical protein
MKGLWEKYAPYWHICTTIIAAACFGFAWVQNVSGYGGRIDSLEAAQKREEKRETRMDYNIQVIAQKLHAPYLKPVDDQ